MTRRVPFARPLVAALIGALASAFPGAQSALAQRVTGPWDDVWTLPAGALRLSIAPSFLSGTDRYSLGGTREPLGSSYAGMLGASSFAGLQSFDNAIGEMSGVRSFRATLGTATADQRLTAAVIPFALSVGITRRLTVNVMVPYHTGQNEMQWLLDGSTATVGANPALLGAGSLATNTAVLSGLDGAAATLEQLADACATNAGNDPRCALVNAEITDVRALIDQARTMSNGLASTYGGRSGTAPSLFVPFANSPAHSGIGEQIESMRSNFERYGTTSVASGAAPVGAGAPPTLTQLTALLSDSAYGYLLGPITRRYQQGVGDIDAGISLLVYDGLNSPDPWTRARTARVSFRQTFGFTYRVGTGTPPSPNDPLRVPTGDGQDDLELMSATDVIFGKHLWGSVVLRWTTQQARDGITRIPDGTGSPFVPLARRRLARTELGDRIAIEAAPRWALNDFFAAGARWRWTRQQGATVTELAPLVDATPLTYTGPNASTHEVGFAFSWSNIASWRAHKSGWPIELEWEHSVVVAGSGNVPKLSSDRFSIRAFARLWGR